MFSKVFLSFLKLNRIPISQFFKEWLGFSLPYYWYVALIYISIRSVCQGKMDNLHAIFAIRMMRRRMDIILYILRHVATDIA